MTRRLQYCGGGIVLGLAAAMALVTAAQAQAPGAAAAAPGTGTAGAGATGAGRAGASGAGLLPTPAAPPPPPPTPLPLPTPLPPALGLAETQPMMVYDFMVATGVDLTLGHRAASRLAAELQKSNLELRAQPTPEAASAANSRFHPTSRAMTQRRLALAAGAKSIITGRVARLALSNPRQPLWARVDLEVRQLDVTTGAYLNGAQVSEATGPRESPGNPAALIEEALNRAVALAARSMKNNGQPLGTKAPLEPPAGMPPAMPPATAPEGPPITAPATPPTTAPVAPPATTPAAAPATAPT